MPYTVPVLDITPAAAACYLVDPLHIEDSAPLSAPIANIGRVLFHSDLAYYEVVQDQTVSVTFPARAYNEQSANSSEAAADEYGAATFRYLDYQPFSALSLPSVPFAAAIYGAAWASGPVLVQAEIWNGGSNYKPMRRHFELRASVAGLSLRERWWFNPAIVSNDVNQVMSAITISVRGVVFRRRVAVAGEPLVDIHPAAGIVKLGRGLLDASGNTKYLRQSSTATGLAFTGDRTIDMSATGVREWRSDGSVVDYGSYSGGYGGPTLRHVSIS